MKPTKFKAQNCVYKLNHPKYPVLPAHKTHDGQVITCWRLSWEDRIKMLVSGKVWLWVLTGNKAMQPVAPIAVYPFVDLPKEEMS